MIITLVGARPQFVKAAIVSRALRSAGISECLVHSGQHYDSKMSQVFWDELQLPEPMYKLEVGSGSHSAQTALIMTSFEDVLIQMGGKADAVLLYGDTNTTLAGALVASKMHIPVIHVEAGLRSFNRSMPEEINRVVTDHLSHLLFCSSAVGVEQLRSEGIEKNVFDVGDVMYDAFLHFSSMQPDQSSVFQAGESVLFTLHRPSNTDDPEILSAVLKALAALEHGVVWPVHPRLKQKIAALCLPENVRVVDPLSYFQILLALRDCQLVITDSGGLQKETYWAKKPCITLRGETEWVETVSAGWNQLIDPSATMPLLKMFRPLKPWVPLYGDGEACSRIARILGEHASPG